MEKKEIRILSRKSDLAKIQAKLVGFEFQRKFPNINISYLTKKTLGDVDRTTPLSKMPTPGVFTDDLRKSLIDNECDLVVHSWKDLPLDIGLKTIIAGSLKRADERDLLLVDKKKIEKIKKLKKINILSSSPRRIYNLKDFIENYFPYQCKEIFFKNVRGNIPTRLDKLFQEDNDALVVAKAAIDRLISNPFDEFNELSIKIKNYINQCLWVILPLSVNPSSPGQGALALEIRKEDNFLNDAIKNFSDPLSVVCAEKERSILKSYGGGCHQNIGVSFFPTFFGLIKCKKGKIENNEKFYEWKIDGSNKEKKAKAQKFEIFPENLIDYKFYNRKIIESSIQKINSIKNYCLWISRNSAIPEHAKISSTNIVWTSGLKTWKSLSKRQIWVNGTADSMGEDFNPNISTLCNFPWKKLTHSKSPISAIKDVLATYELIELDNLPDLSSKKYFYWMSSSAFNLAITREPKVLEGNHSCGPGNTFKEIKKMIKDPTKLTIKLSYDDWKKDILDD